MLKIKRSALAMPSIFEGRTKNKFALCVSLIIVTWLIPFVLLVLGVCLLDFWLLKGF